MKKNLKQAPEKIITFLFFCIIIALAVGILIMISYFIIWGLILGSLLWIVTFLKKLIYSEKKINNQSHETLGRIIEHDDKE
ncbi:MAG: hypothetical protein H0T84_03790 [Tatlockia sp.]|nr:hypothetical protein [Tatlockia sp.]